MNGLRILETMNDQRYNLAMQNYKSYGAFRERLHELTKGPVFSAKTEQLTTYVPEIRAENGPL